MSTYDRIYQVACILDWSGSWNELNQWTATAIGHIKDMQESSSKDDEYHIPQVVMRIATVYDLDREHIAHVDYMLLVFQRLEADVKFWEAELKLTKHLHGIK